MVDIQLVNWLISLCLYCVDQMSVGQIFFGETTRHRVLFVNKCGGNYFHVRSDHPRLQNIPWGMEYKAFYRWDGSS
jgi:hypothetical protein